MNTSLTRKLFEAADKEGASLGGGSDGDPDLPDLQPVEGVWWGG